jgi:hypothetical protein
LFICVILSPNTPTKSLVILFNSVFSSAVNSVLSANSIYLLVSSSVLFIKSVLACNKSTVSSFTPPNSPLKRPRISVKFSTVPLINEDKTPSPSSILKINPSQADWSLIIAPFKVSNWVAAVLAANPVAFSNDSSKASTLSVVSANIVPIVAPLLPNNSRAAAFLLVAFCILPNASSYVKPLLANSKNTFLNPVAAVEASTPLSDKVPSKAVVLSKLTPAFLAVAPTIGNAVLNFWKSNALREADLAKISFTLVASEASKLKPLIIEPVNAACSPSSLLKAAEASNVDSVTCNISCCVKPNLAYSVWSSETWDAVKAVVEPNLLASSVSCVTWSIFNPNTAAKLAWLCSKSLNTLTLSLKAFVRPLEQKQFPI